MKGPCLPDSAASLAPTEDVGPCVGGLAAGPARPALRPSAPRRLRERDRAAFESKPRISVLISTGIASLGWISKDSVTNEKHTSS